MSHSLRPLAIVVGLTLAFPALAAKPAKPAPAHEAVSASATAASADFELAHNLSPEGEKALQAIVDRFNTENNGNLKVSRLEKGEKPAGLNLVRRYDMSEVLSQSKHFVPLHEMMAKAGVKLDADGLSSDLKANIVDAKGRLVALPVLYSTPVLFYNKNAFRKAKLNPDQPPKTWFEMQGMLDKLQEAGYACPYTTAWPVWVHVDNVSTISGLPATTDKGQLVFNGLPQVKHVAMMATWTKANYFKLFGRGDEASKKFHAGECAMITTDSREHIDFRDAKGVELGVAPLPYHDDVYGAPKNTLADGASLWLASGMKPAEIKGVAKFVNYVLGPEVQIGLTLAGGYLPMTPVARAAASTKLLGADLGGLKIAYAQLQGKGVSPKVRVAQIEQVRQIVEEELETVWADKKPAKEALDNAVARGNAAMLKIAALDETTVAPKSKGKGKK